MHFMYPHHTWLTNPVLAFLEFLRPSKRYNGMALADMKLRHSAVTPCGGAATTFIEIYRALGGEATLVKFRGPPSHLVAEAKIGKERYFVDANLEVIVPLSTEESAANRALVTEYYAHLPEERLSPLLGALSRKPELIGYDGAPTATPFGYRMQRLIEVVKFAIPITGFAFFALLRQRLRATAPSANLH